jgi:hypothetical protein
VTGPIRGAINRRSKRKFDEFWFALQTVGDALMQAEQLAAKLRDHRPTHQGPGNQGDGSGGGPGGRGGRGGNRASNGVNGRIPWSAATPEELRAAAKKAHASLRVMSTTAKRWEADLVSKDWR